jgi:hypothetical protein
VHEFEISGKDDIGVHAMIENRSKRSLLFGGRTSAVLGDSATEAVEIENQRNVERLGGSAAMMKDVAIAIETDVVNQNKMLVSVDRRFDSTSSAVERTLFVLKDMVNDRARSRLCSFVGGFFGILVVGYYIFKVK